MTNNEANRNEGKRTVPCKVLKNPQTKKREVKAARKVINSDGGCETKSQRLSRVRAVEMKSILKTLNDLEGGDLHQFKDLMQKFNKPEFVRKEPFANLCNVFCDGIRINKLDQVFASQAEFTSFLKDNTRFEIQNVFGSMKTCDYFIKFKQHSHDITEEFMLNLKELVCSLKQAALYKQKDIEVFINQIDFTVNVGGFFYSFNVKADKKRMAEDLCQQGFRAKKDYKSFSSCFQFTNGSTSNPMSKRIKVYNKFLDCLQSESVKKAIGTKVK